MNVPQPLLELDLASLVGLALAAATETVQSAGGVVRALAPGQPMTLEYRANRVTLLVQDGYVVSVHGIG